MVFSTIFFFKIRFWKLSEALIPQHGKDRIRILRQPARAFEEVVHDATDHGYVWFSYFLTSFFKNLAVVRF